MPLSEQVYCVAVTGTKTERVEQRICIKFVIKLELPSVETILMIQKSMLWATGDWQLHNNAPTHASCLM